MARGIGGEVALGGGVCGVGRATNYILAFDRYIECVVRRGQPGINVYFNFDQFQSQSKEKFVSKTWKNNSPNVHRYPH